MTKFILLTAAAIAISGAAMAEEDKAPTLLTDAQMEQIVAGGWIYNRGTYLAFYNYDSYYSVQAGDANTTVSPPVPNDGQGMVNGCRGEGLSGDC